MQQFFHDILSFSTMGCTAWTDIKIQACKKLAAADAESFSHNAFKTIAVMCFSVSPRYSYTQARL